MSNEVQEYFEEAATAFFANSLAAERKAAEVKRREARNITLVGNVSRDLLCKRFTREREAQARVLEDAAKDLRDRRKASWVAIAWAKHDAAPPGIPFQRPATGGHL